MAELTMGTVVAAMVAMYLSPNINLASVNNYALNSGASITVTLGAPTMNGFLSKALGMKM